MKTIDRNRTLLVIDDDQVFCQALIDDFSSEGIEVFAAFNKTEGLRICSQHKIDVVLLDQKLPDGKGVTLCEPILELNDQTKIIFITAFPTFDNALQAIKAGAYDYLSKPIDLEELHLAIERAFRVLELEKTSQFSNYRLKKEKENSLLVGNFGGRGDIERMLHLAASVDSPLLITGETGTGKNVVAHVVHFKSNNSEAPFIYINCAALPENLVESELFGYEKGAFTGASGMKKGIFEIAEGGTLLLDEIGAMPLHLQAKLLGVLDDGKIRRLGGQSLIPVHVRIIAATNSNLEIGVKEKQFREDLFYRLSVLRLHLPPLRERKEDIPELCGFFISQIAGKRKISIPENEFVKLKDYSWPGNIRELKNIIERAILLHGDILYPSLLIGNREEKSGTIVNPDSSTIANWQTGGNASSTDGKLQTLEEINKDYIHYVLQTCSGNLSKSARTLGISLSTLKRKLKEYGIRNSEMVQNKQD